jgi:hypothetical protein
MLRKCDTQILFIPHLPIISFLSPSLQMPSSKLICLHQTSTSRHRYRNHLPSWSFITFPTGITTLGAAAIVTPTPAMVTSIIPTVMLIFLMVIRTPNDVYLVMGWVWITR